MISRQAVLNEIRALRWFARPWVGLALAACLIAPLSVPPAALALSASPPVETEEIEEEIDADEDDSELTPFEDAVEDFDLVNNTADGREPTLFTIYRKEDQVLALVPNELLDTPWLLGASIASGPLGTGEQLGSTALEWRRRGDELDLYQPELRYTSSTKPTLEEGVKRAFTDRHILSVAVISETDDAALIDLSSFVTDNASALVGLYGSIDGSASRVEKIKAFPHNVELAITAPLSLPSELFGFFNDIEGQLQTLHFSFSALPEDTSFEQRAADPRVGYWVHANMDIGRRQPLESDMVRTIERWDLRKSDPDSARSAPEKPIIFYIENTVPIAYRVHVRRGVEAWNEAFRAVGIENAIEVRQQTDTQYTDIDPEDIRYNFVRWVPTGFGYAIALHRTDPRTGQILDADVVIDDGWLNYWVDEYPLLTQEAVAARYEAMARQQPSMARVVEALSDSARARGLLPPALGEPAAAKLSERDRARAWREAAGRAAPGALTSPRTQHERCSYAHRLGHHMALANLSFIVSDEVEEDADAGADAPAADDGPPMIDGAPEDLIAHNLIALVAHEVGHVLGLRHNFAASAWMPASAIDTYTDPAQETIAGSVMDYIGTFVADVDKPQGVYNMTRVGPYDRWAIAYGYMDGDEDELSAHLARSVEPQHRYMTDEDVYSADPTPMRYDFGSDPVEGRTRQLRRIDYLRERLVDRLATDGANWSKVRRAFNALWFEEMSLLWDATGWIGGTYLSRDFNTPGARPPMVNVEPERQRAVLRMLIDRLFSESSLRFDRGLLNSLQTVRWYDSNFPSWNWDGAGDIDVLDQANTAHFIVLSELMFTSTPRLANQELRTDPSVDALTLPEMHRELTAAIWSEFDAQPAAGGAARSNLDPMVGGIRRALQREHAGQLIDLAYRFRYMPATFASAQLVAVDQLREIKKRLENWGGDHAALDDYSRIHVREMLALIDATLEAQVTRAP